MYRLVRTLRAAFLLSAGVYLAVAVYHTRPDLSAPLRQLAVQAETHGSTFVARAVTMAADTLETLTAQVSEWLKQNVPPRAPTAPDIDLRVRGTQNEDVTPPAPQPEKPKFEEEEETQFAGLPERPLEPLSPVNVMDSLIPLKPQEHLAPVQTAENIARAATAPVLTQDAVPQSEGARVAQHLRVNLSRDLYQNFDLFLYVSKAKSGEDAGPWAQKLFVLAKKKNGLSLLHEWAASTGREKVEFNARGERLPTFTPAGLYQLDPDRFYKGYRSEQWGASMPFAMFFNWIERGNQTGLAIHGAGTEAEIALLGQRASAGCVRIAPDKAALLFNMIRKDYRGQAARFAYNKKTKTMSNRGELMRGKNGAILYRDGYRVLVVIEDEDGRLLGSQVS